MVCFEAKLVPGFATSHHKAREHKRKRFGIPAHEGPNLIGLINRQSNELALERGRPGLPWFRVKPNKVATIGTVDVRHLQPRLLGFRLFLGLGRRWRFALSRAADGALGELVGVEVPVAFSRVSTTVCKLDNVSKPRPVRSSSFSEDRGVIRSPRFSRACSLSCIPPVSLPMRHARDCVQGILAVAENGVPSERAAIRSASGRNYIERSQDREHLTTIRGNGQGVVRQFGNVPRDRSSATKRRFDPANRIGCSVARTRPVGKNRKVLFQLGRHRGRGTLFRQSQTPSGVFAHLFL